MKEILHKENPVNKDVFVQVSKSQFVNDLLDKFQAVAFFFPYRFSIYTRVAWTGTPSTGPGAQSHIQLGHEHLKKGIHNFSVQ